MSSWLPRILTRIRDLAARDRILFTRKAQRELASLGGGLDPDDARDVILCLTHADFAGRVASKQTGEWMYAFTPLVGGERLYVKLILRSDCVVVSFHEDEDDEDGDVE